MGNLMQIPAVRCADETGITLFSRHSKDATADCAGKVLDAMPH